MLKCGRGDKILKSKNKLPVHLCQDDYFEIIKQMSYEYIEHERNQHYSQLPPSPFRKGR